MKLKFYQLILQITILFFFYLPIYSSFLPSLSTTKKPSPPIIECIPPGTVCVDDFHQKPCSGGFSCQIKNESQTNDFNKQDYFQTETNSYDFVCKERKSLGKKCNLHSDCSEGLSCYSPSDDSDQYCIDYKFSYHGESCEFNHQCIGTLKCRDSICTNINDQCSDTLDCPSEYYCNSINCKVESNCSNSRCNPLKTLNQQCTYSNECALNFICAGGRCIEKYSLQIGDKCFDDFDDSYAQCDISKSLICKDFKCKQRNETKTFNCRNDGCLYEDEICDGSTNRCVHKEKIFTKNCIESEKERNFCYVSNKCAFLNGEDPNLNKRSCIMKNCGVETIEYLKQCDRSYSLYLLCNNKF